MWSTPHGDRTLSGDEAELIREAASVMIDELDMFVDQPSFPPLELDVPVWDGLAWQQKLATLDLVVHHLLRPTPKPLPLTAVHTAAIGAIFAKIQSSIEVELEMVDEEFESTFEEFDSWRQLVWRVLLQWEEEGVLGGRDEELDQDEGDRLFPDSPEDQSLERWFRAVEFLTDRILWDRDYEMEALFGDLEPDKAAILRGCMGVQEGYYREVGPDLRDDQVASVMERIRTLTHRR